MKSTAALLAVLLGSLSATLPAAAETRIATSMPVVAANLSDGELRVRFADSRVFNAPRRNHRTIVVSAFDANGGVVATQETVFSRRLGYASLTLPASFAAAHRISVSER